MNEKLKTYLKTLKHNEVLFDYLQMKKTGIDNPKIAKMGWIEKGYLGSNYFLYKFAEQSGITNADILGNIDGFYYRNSKIHYLCYKELQNASFEKIHNVILPRLMSTLENTSVGEIIDDAEEVLKLVFEGGAK